MRHRYVGLAAAVLLAVPVLSSCRNPGNGGGGGRPTTTMPGGGGGGNIPGPALGQQNCGTINKDDPPTAAERQSATCFLQYHGVVASVYLKITSNGGADVVVAQAATHTVTVTRATNGVVTKRTVCSGLPNSQFSVDGSGNLVGILGNACRF